MKVLVVSNLYPPDVVGGYELGCRQAVDALRMRGIDVRVATSVPRVPVPSVAHVRRVFQLADNWSSYLNSRRSSLQWDLHIASSYLVNAFNVHALLQLVEEFAPDVIYLWSLEGIGGLGLVGSLEHLRLPWVWHLMDRVPVMVCSDRSGLVPTLVSQFNRHARGTYLACSQTVSDEIERAGVRIADAVQLVPNWVHGAPPRMREHYLQGGHLRVMHAAAQLSTGCDKGTDLVVEAAALLRDTGRENFCVDIYGNTPDRSIPDLVLTRDLQSHVRLLGWRSQEELKALHADYDVFAFPTRAREPFAFSPLEAAAAGCVPLLSQVCGNSEWFVHDVHVLKTPRDPRAIARALARVLDGEVDLSGLGRRGAALVRREFHIDAVVPRIIAALQQASTRSRDGAGRPADAYRLAMMAERLTQVSIQEHACA